MDGDRTRIFLFFTDEKVEGKGTLISAMFMKIREGLKTSLDPRNGGSLMQEHEETCHVPIGLRQKAYHS